MSVDAPRFHRRKKRTPPYLLIGAVVLVALVVYTLSRPVEGPAKGTGGTDPTSLDSLQFPPFQAAALRWGSRAWNGDSVPYLHARERVDTALTSGLNVDDEIRQAQLDVLKTAQTQRDPRLVYAWAYAQYLKVSAEPSSKVDPRLVQVMDAADPLDVFDYSRLKFLLVMPADKHIHPELESIGKALIAHSPTDDALKVAYINNIGGGDTLPKALSFAKQWEASAPQADTPHLMLGLLYNTYFDDTDNAAYLDKVSAEFHTYLDRASPHAQSRAWIEQILPRIDLVRLQRHNKTQGAGV